MPGILEEVKKLREIWGGFRSARVLLTANNYRVFDYLIKPLSVRILSKRLNTDLRATEILLDALTGLGFLKKMKGKYSNSPITSKFMVSGSPYYQGDIIRHADTLWQNWSGLDEVLKTGKPNRKTFDHGSFILGMHNIASLKAKDVMKMIGLKGVKTALDLGGGPGTYSIEMAKRGVNVTLFDFPETIEIAKRVISNPSFFLPLFKGRIGGVKGGEGEFERSFRGKISFIQGDFLVDDFGCGYDLIFISQVFHAYSERDNLQLLRKCRKALNDGGRIVIQDFYISKDRTHPAQSALFSVNMLVNTEGGRCYSAGEIKRWLLRIGLKDIKEDFIDDSVLIEGVMK
ncbi:MAG: methyltransferase [Nitrospirota bacterium]